MSLTWLFLQIAGVTVRLMAVGQPCIEGDISGSDCGSFEDRERDT